MQDYNNAFPLFNNCGDKYKGFSKMELAAITIASGMVVGRGVDLDVSDQESISMVACQIAEKILNRISRETK